MREARPEAARFNPAIGSSPSGTTLKQRKHKELSGRVQTCDVVRLGAVAHVAELAIGNDRSCAGPGEYEFDHAQAKASNRRAQAHDGPRVKARSCSQKIQSLRLIS
jgi:hypothetical protein